MSIAAKNPVRIGIDARPGLWQRTGIGTIVDRVLSRLPAMDPAKRFIAYFDQDPSAYCSQLEGIRCEFGTARHEFLWSNLVLAPRVRRDKIDILLTLIDREVPLVPMHCRVISMIHDLIPMKFPADIFRSPLHRAYYNTMLRHSARRSDLILTNSLYSQRELIEELGLPASKIRPITLGVDPSPATSEISAVLAQYKVYGRYVVALGSTEPRKNNLRLIEAMQLVRRVHPDVQLLIVGGLWRGQVFPAGSLQEGVRSLGYVPDKDFHALLRGATVFAYPSLHEGFGLPVLEAMSAGTPVVTSSVTALPEVGGEAALYVDPLSVSAIAEALCSLIGNEPLRLELIDRGYARARSFSWDKTCRDILAVCDELIPGGATNGEE